MVPPTHVCLDAKCRKPLESDPDEMCDRELKEALSYPVTVFTQAFGPMPGFCTSMYCRSACHCQMYQL